MIGRTNLAPIYLLFRRKADLARPHRLQRHTLQVITLLQLVVLAPQRPVRTSAAGRHSPRNLDRQVDLFNVEGRKWSNLLRAMFLLLLLTSSSFAASVSSSYTCVQGHEQQAMAKLQAFGVQALKDFFKTRNIDINESTIKFNVTLSTQTDGDGVPYIAFTGNVGGGTGLTGSAIAGTVAASDGTKFNVLFSSGSDNQDNGEYRIVTTQSGFDREGNPIDRHCRLKLFDAGDSEASKTLLVLNAGSGHILGLIPLPQQLPLY